MNEVIREITGYVKDPEFKMIANHCTEHRLIKRDVIQQVLHYYARSKENDPNFFAHINQLAIEAKTERRIAKQKN